MLLGVVYYVKYEGEVTVGKFLEIRNDVEKLLGGDVSGHGLDHVDRVDGLSHSFALQEGADVDVVELTALLHDVDDYKIFGEESAHSLLNANRILNSHRVDRELARQVLQIIPSMGYNNYLEGIRPESLEGQIVSDADMCDAIGAQGLIRVFEYNASKGRAFFNKNLPPASSEITVDEYRRLGSEHAVQHFFDKLLLIPDILMTGAGRREGQERAEIMVKYLRELFREEGAQDWSRHLDSFLGQKS